MPAARPLVNRAQLVQSACAGGYDRLAQRRDGRLSHIHRVHTVEENRGRRDDELGKRGRGRYRNAFARARDSTRAQAGGAQSGGRRSKFSCRRDGAVRGRHTSSRRKFMLDDHRCGMDALTRASDRTSRPSRLWAETQTDFFLKEVDAQISFVLDAQGTATSLVLHQNGQEPARQESFSIAANLMNIRITVGPMGIRRSFRGRARAEIVCGISRASARSSTNSFRRGGAGKLDEFPRRFRLWRAGRKRDARSGARTAVVVSRCGQRNRNPYFHARRVPASHERGTAPLSGDHFITIGEGAGAASAPLGRGLVLRAWRAADRV